ncbi:hypothetical protein [Cystobacter fuscus]|uniref:hypothetical protein n=1 Tax=Cystobacter fuscus TaxID=43 RepID=UPI002B289C60|nr:hypothetical protein F0U63_05685 [Cystobacter fuscus]
MKTSSQHLLLGGLTLMMAACTPPDLDISATPAEIESEEISLTSAAPKVAQRLVLVASVKEGTKVRIGSAWLSLSVSHGWKQPTDDTAEVIPWFRIRIVNERDGSVHAERSILPNDIYAPNPMTFYGLDDHGVCRRAEERCEVPIRIELERQGPPSEGTVDVRWKATGYANADEAEGSNLEVRLVRPREN